MNIMKYWLCRIWHFFLINYILSFVFPFIFIAISFNFSFFLNIRKLYSITSYCRFLVTSSRYQTTNSESTIVYNEDVYIMISFSAGKLRIKTFFRSLFSFNCSNWKIRGVNWGKTRFVVWWFDHMNR